MISSEKIQVLHPLLRTHTHTHTHIHTRFMYEHMICGDVEENLWIP